MSLIKIENRGPHFSLIIREGDFAGFISAVPDAIITINLVGGMFYAGFQSMEEAQAFILAL